MEFKRKIRNLIFIIDIRLIMTNFTGIFAATITPMNKDFSINIEVFKNYLIWIKNQGVSGFAINVDTGEGPSLTSEERMKLLTITKEISGDLRIIAGIIGGSTESAVNEARNAISSGADTLLIFPNAAFRGKPQDSELIFKYHEAIASETDADIILFNLQDELGGCLYTNETLEKLLLLPQVKALKEASFEISTFKMVSDFLKKRDKKISFLTGNDNFIMKSFMMGVDGGLLGSCAQLTRVQVECFNNVKKKRYDIAIEMAKLFRPIIDVIFMTPVRNYRARTKYSLMLQGIIPNSYVRPPLLDIPEYEKIIIKEVLTSAKLIK